MIIMFGVPENPMEMDQRGGRGGRDGTTECLVLIIAESWALLDNSDTNPHRQKCAKELRTDIKIFCFVRSEDCRRHSISDYNNDKTINGKLL